MSSHERDLPSRPSLPPLLLAALSAWIAVCLSEELCWQLYADARMAAVLLMCLIVLVAIGTIILAIKHHGFAVVCIAFISVCICGLFWWGGWAKDVERLPALLEQTPTLELDLTGDPAARDYGTISTARINCNAGSISMRLIWPEGAEPLAAGHRIAVTGNVSSPKLDDGGRWNHRNGFAGMLRASHVEELGYSPGLRGFVTAFRDDSFARVASIEGDAAGLLAGILLGNRTLYAGSELEQAFQTTGLAHLMAVSGTHLAIVTMLLSALLARSPLRRKVRSAVLIIGLIIYVAITGFAPSALRAATMCSVALVLGALKTRASALSALSLCALVFLGLSPPIAFSLGFQLSVLSVLGLIIFARLADCWLGHALPRLPPSLVSSVAATIVASSATLPMTVTQFAQLPLISPVANLLAAPLVTGMLCLGIIALVTGSVFAPLGVLLLQIAATLASCCAALVRMLADMPLACLPLSSATHAIAVLFCVLFIALWAFWPLPQRSAGCERRQGPPLPRNKLLKTCTALIVPIVLVLLLGFGQSARPWQTTDARMVMLDVGQGDSILIQSKAASILVDTGEQGDVLLRELAEQGVTHLDAVIISHKDADHAGALKKLAGVVAVDHVYVHADLIGQAFMEKVLESARWVTNGREAEGVRPGAILQAGQFSLNIIAPQDGGKSENEDSLVGLLEFDADGDGSVEARGLLTGDAESEALNRVVSQVGDIDFLKVAHHGSKGGLTDEQLTGLSPEIALISVGADNKYGHPSIETVKMLEDHGVRIYRTDKQGAISAGFSSTGMRVTPER